MNNIRDIPEESVRQLATTLKASGLAASETEAIRMAMSMSHTNSKVSNAFEQKKEKNIMGLSHLNKETKDQKDARLSKQEENKQQQDSKVEVPKTAEQIVEEQRNVANNIQSAPVEQYEEEIDLSNVTLEEASSGQINTDSATQEQTQEQTVETTQEPQITEIVEEPKEEINIEFKDDEEFIVQDVVKSDPTEEKDSSEAQSSSDKSSEDISSETQTEEKSAPQEQPQQAVPNTPIRKPKKDISEMAESRVDLGSVFNFSNK